MKIKLCVVLTIISFTVSACVSDGGKGGQSLGINISNAITSGIQTIKNVDGNLAGSAVNNYPIENTPLYKVFDGKSFDNSEASSYPRVAITVVTSPTFHSHMLPLGGYDRNYESGCFILSATVWHSKSQKEVIDRFDVCTPSDGVYEVPLADVNQWAIRPVIMGVLEDTGTGLRRTTGPGVPTNAIPKDPHTQKYLRSTSIDVKQYDGFMLASVLYKMGFDWSQSNDRRVWIVSFPAGM